MKRPYYACADSDELPEQLFFSEQNAIDAGREFIFTHDVKGNIVEVHKFFEGDVPWTGKYYEMFDGEM